MIILMHLLGNNGNVEIKEYISKTWVYFFFCWCIKKSPENILELEFIRQIRTKDVGLG